MGLLVEASPLKDLREEQALEQTKEGEFASAYGIFRELSNQYPENTDYLFYCGLLASWLRNWVDSEMFFQKCLNLAPQYLDAAMQLGNVYLYTQQWNEAERLFSFYPEELRAKEGLAKCALWRGDYFTAEERYRKIFDSSECDEEARLGLARALAQQQKYRESLSFYDMITQPDFQGILLEPEKISVASRVHISSLVDINYMQSQESDPQLNAPAAKDYGIASSLSLFIPLANLWRLDAKGVFYTQVEKNIFPPTGTNYNVLFSELGAFLHYFFTKEWRWDFFTKVLSGWKNGSMRFPFQNQTIVEPGSTLFYNGQRQFFLLNSFYDTMLIKDYARNVSKLLPFITTEGGYGYRPPIRLHPELEGRIGWAFYRDSLHNIRNRQDLWVRVGLPYLSKIVTAIYHFEHASFSRLSPNYYSYKNKWFQGLGVRFYREFSFHGFLEFFYEHTWDLTFNLFEPIGTFLFVAPRQYLIGNKIFGSLGYAKDRYRIELSGHYFENNLPYHDWNTKASFLWQF